MASSHLITFIDVLFLLLHSIEYGVVFALEGDDPKSEPAIL
jgi:hypothetical protein